MSEDTGQSTDTNPSPTLPVAQPEPTAGALIRRAREAAGLHIAALAVSLKVPVKKLEALETDRFELLPNAVYVRALAASVCRALKVDSAQILQLLPHHSTDDLSQRSESRPALVGANISNRPTSLSGKFSKRAVIGGLLLVLGALALVFLPPLDFASSPSEVAEGDGVSTPSLPVMAVEPTAPVPLSAAPSAAAANVNSSAAVAGVLLPAAEGVQTGTPPATGLVVFRPTAESWVEVTDTQGAVLLRRKLLAGEVAGASGALPLNVIVGRADVTQVQIRGQAFDLTPISRDNVARFEVK